jgi:hypothetical protein
VAVPKGLQVIFGNAHDAADAMGNQVAPLDPPLHGPFGGAGGLGHGIDRMEPLQAAWAPTTGATHMNWVEIAPYVRAFGGWTASTFGGPSETVCRSAAGKLPSA